MSHSPFERWWNRGRYRPRRPVFSRRGFIVAGVFSTLIGAVLARLGTRQGYLSDENAQFPVRPPGASADDNEFQSKCIRCGMCGIVCENGCIRFHGFEESENGALTPFLDVRRRSCTLCMRCTDICPTGALKPIIDSKEEILKNVSMGLAVIDPQRCFSYLGRVCGYCHDACPFPEIAIKLTAPSARPFVFDKCVGCGRCVEECPQNPAAIDIRKVISREATL